MKKIYFTLALVFGGLLMSNKLYAQIPIVYYDCENNTTRSTLEVTPEMAVNSASNITYGGGTGVCTSIGCPNAQGLLGAASDLHGGSVDGASVSVSGWPSANGGTGASTYFQFNVSTAGFSGISLTFDTKYGNNNAPSGIGILISPNGSTWTMVGTTSAPSGNTIPAPSGTHSWTTNAVNLTAASAAIANNNSTLYIRIYGYGASATGNAAYLGLDNITVLATSTVAGKVFTTLNENTYYTGYTSGLTGNTLARNSFTATGASTNMTINGTSGLKLNSGQTLSVTSSAAVKFLSTGTLSGTGGNFSIASGCQLETANTGGIPGSITATGTKTYTAGANYNILAATTTPFPTGTFGNPANVYIAPGASNTVALNISPTISGLLTLFNGKLSIANNTLTLNGDITYGSGLLVGSATSNLNINGTGAFGNLSFDQTTDGVTNNLATLAINRTSSGAIGVVNKLVTGTACNITTGNLTLGSATLLLNGTFSGSASGYLTCQTGSTLIIGGTGALGTLFFDQSTPGTTNLVSTFTLNRASSGIATIGNALSVGTGGLNLTNGTLADGGNIIALSGNITGTGSHGGSGKILMNGSGATISSVSLGNLELNNIGGFSLTGSPSIGGTLTMVSGKLTLGTNTLTFGIAAALAGVGSASNMIVANGTGKVRKLFSSNGSFFFPIGDNTNFTPIALNFTGGSYAVGAYAEVNVKTAKHPNNANTTDYLNRYWSVNTAGITSPVYALSSATYAITDVTGTEGNISTGQYTGALPWLKFGTTNTGTHTLSSTTVTATSCDFTGVSTAAPTVSSSSNIAICTDASTTLSASGATGDPVLTYQWAPTTGLSATTGSSVVATPPSTTTYTVTVIDGNGFTGTATTTVSVNPIPSITGNTSVCVGVANTLSHVTTGGTWISSDITKATIGSLTGNIIGVAPGTTTVSYTTPTGCVTTIVATVLPIPANITGNLSVCTGSTTALGHPVSGGTWASNATGNASINSSGVVSGILAGNPTITYTLPSGCITTAEVTVQPVPEAITGAAAMCYGSCSTLAHPVSGGTWASSNLSIATINAFGIVSCIDPGTATITYTLPNACYTTIEITINELPASITGGTVVCENSVTPLSNATSGGTWSSSLTSVATVSTSGVVTGVAAGTASIIYTLPTNCATSTTVTVNAQPGVITGTNAVCDQGTTSLTSATAGGTWSSTTLTVGTVSTTGMVTGIAPGITTISYEIANGCSRQTFVTVNPLPGVVGGDLDICEGTSTTLTNSATGGTWYCSCVFPVSISTGGVFYGATAGTTDITYELPTGCISTGTVTVDPLPTAITGLNEVCVNGTTTLFNFTFGGTWSCAAVGTATVNATTGEVTGIAEGITTISYTLPTGCYSTITLSVNPLPVAITGASQVCFGSITLLSNSDIGGVWNSSNNTIAAVDASGNVSGDAVGSVNITYTLPTGCKAIHALVVNPLPATITGTALVCANSTTTLSNSSLGGTWSSNDAGIADVNPSSGAMTGIAPGNTIITYTLPTTCNTTIEATVNATPSAIGGPSSVCMGSSISLTNTDMGGTWSSSNTAVATINTAGNVNGLTAGTSTITYMFGTGCNATLNLTVNPLPATIVGPSVLCNGQTVTYTTASTGVSWSSSDNAVVNITSSGIATGLTTSTTTIICQFIATGCAISTTLTVNPLPAVITGQTEICVGSFSTLDNATLGGTWTSSNPGIVAISAAGIMAGITDGNATITYTAPNNCIQTAAIIIDPLPNGIVGATQLCQGTDITVSNTTLGGAWSSSSPSVASVNAAGTVSGLLPGTTTIFYTLATSCKASLILTVNPAVGVATGPLQVCPGNSYLYSNTPVGGTWSCACGGSAIISPSGIFSALTAGTNTVTYTTPQGCIGTTTILTNPLPLPITGAVSACIGLTSTLASSDAGGTWSSGNISVASVDAAGVVSAVSVGTAMITYTLPTGCITKKVFTSKALPAAITGGTQVCPGLSTTLHNSTPDGTWTSGDAAIAGVTSLTGIVSAIAAGTVNITYTLPTGCIASRTMTVNPAVSPIVGTGAVCVGATSSLSNPDAGGVWISNNTSIAGVAVIDGIVTGVNAGTVKITYTLPTSCLTTSILTVNPLPATINGVPRVCEGLTTTLSNITGGGTWSGGTTGIATISTTGVVSGIAEGTASVTYTLATGCARSKDITVNALPALQTVTGGGSYCAGGSGVHIGLDNSLTTATYKLYRGTFLASSLAGTGLPIDFGAYTAIGTYTVLATNAGTGCINSMTGNAIVSTTPHIVPSVSLSSSLGDTLCSGTATTYTATPMNGGTAPTYQWFVNNVSSGAGSTFAYTPVHGDSIMVKLTSSETCASPVIVLAKKRMNVIDNQMPTIAITQTTSDTVCMHDLASFSAMATWTGSTPTYTWVKNGADVATGTSYTYIPNNGDIISCRLTSNYRCRLADAVTSTGITLNVDSVYIPSVSITATPGLTIAPGATCTLTATTTDAGPAPVYIWKLNGTVITGATSSTFAWQFDNNDEVTCIVWGSGNCGLPSFNIVTIKVDEAAGIHTNSITKDDLKLIPNPNKGEFVITGNAWGNNRSEDLQLEVTNVLGQVIYTHKLTINNKSINEKVSLDNTLPNGMYLLHIRSNTERKTLHFVISK